MRAPSRDHRHHSFRSQCRLALRKLIKFQSKGFVSILVVLSLSAQLLIVGLTRSEPASAAPVKLKKTTDLSPLPSDPPPRRQLDIPKGDFSNPPLGEAAREVMSARDVPMDIPNAMTLERDETSVTFSAPHGNRLKRIYPEPINFLDNSGNWTPFDNTLLPDSSGRLRNRVGPASIGFAMTTEASQLLAIDGSGWSFSMSLSGASETAHTSFADNRVRYSEILPDTDLSYEIQNYKIKELMVLKTRQSVLEAATISFLLETNGLVGRSDTTGIVFAGPTGEDILTIPNGVAFDSADSPSQFPVRVVLRQDLGRSVIDVLTDAAWLSDPSRVFPITIDPTVIIGKATPTRDAWDAYASNRCPTCNYNATNQQDACACGYFNKVGFESDGYESHTYIKYNLSSLNGKGITSAYWKALPTERRPTTGATNIKLWRVVQDWQDNTITWNTRPNHEDHTYWDLQRNDHRINAQVTATNQWFAVDVTGWVWNWVAGEWSNQGFSLDTAGSTADYLKFAAAEMVYVNQSHYLEVLYHELPSKATAQSPADGAMTNSATPTLSVNASSDPDGNPVRYWFRLASGKDGNTGHVLNSGWISQTSWQPPSGSLIDGATYYWRVFTSDTGGGGYAKSSWVNRLKINLRLGEQEQSVYDAIGPARVNLTNGNLFLKATTPAYQTVGGPIGLSFNYNSRAQLQYGLTASYYNATKEYGFRGQPALVRRDSQVSFDWGTGSPGPGVNSDDFLVRWTGYITVPYTTSAADTNAWHFLLYSDDGVRMWVNGQLYIDNWQDKSFSLSGDSGPLDLVANHAVEVVIEYFERSAPAAIRLDSSGPVNGTIPASWLSPKPLGLPQGWSMSVGDFAGLSYNEAIMLSDSVVLIDSTGGTSEYRKNGGGGYQPIDQETGYLAEEPGSGLILHASDGIVYRFNKQGKLIEARSGVDDLNPAAPRYSWNDQTGRLTSITDRVSNRSINLRFAALPPQGSNDPQCPSWQSGTTLYAPAGMLCKISYWDGNESKFYYDSGGQLARIENPGGEITDFGYGLGVITQIRDPLGADLVAAGSVPDNTSRTTLLYFSSLSFDSVPRVASAQSPAPLRGAAQPRHFYTYTYDTLTKMSLAGLSGNQRTVTLDGQGRVASDADGAGNTTRYAWDSSDRLRFTVDASGLKTSTIYDQNHRPIETYGPAPENWFQSDDKPLPTYIGSVPKSITAYDQGLSGLAASYFPNRNVSGTPSSHETISGSLSKNWGTGQPPNIPSGDNWSSRFTGEILFSSAGTYTLLADTDDGVRVFIGDTPIIDDWRDAAATRTGTFNVASAGSWHRIRIDHYEAGGPASAQLRWRTPTGTTELVPGANLRPSYGLVTSKVEPDGKKTAYGYGSRPELGLTTTTTIDPDNLNLVTRTDYEDLYFRRTKQTPPKGDQSAVQYFYWGASETATHPCTAASLGTQAGLLKQVIKADPDGSGPLAAMSISFIYDQAGRMAARVVAGDSAWTCYSYDARGRILTDRDESGRQTNFSYSGGTKTSSFPDSDGNSRTTTEVLDMLGRISEYTDEHGTRTRRVFDQPGRLTQVHRKFSASPEAQITEYAYDSANRVRSLTDKLSGTNRITTYDYDAAGRLTRVTRPTPNGVVSTTNYDADHRWLDTISHVKGDRNLSLWDYDRNLAGRITREAGGGKARDFTYDGAGRLSEVREQPVDENLLPIYNGCIGCSSTVTRPYAYDANSNRCAMASSCLEPSYQYDNADRIKSSPYASSYSYDNRGNIVGATPTYPASVRNRTWSFPFKRLETISRTVSVGLAGTFNASLSWATDVSRTGSPVGSLNPGQTSSFPIPVEQESFISSKLTWVEGAAPKTSTEAINVQGGSSATKGIEIPVPGDIFASISWNGVSKPYSASGNASSGVPSDHPITVTAGGTISFALAWPAATPNPNLDLFLLNPQGLVVASSTQLAGNSESLTYHQPEQGSEFSYVYTVRVLAVGPGSNYQLEGSYPVSPNVDLQLESSDGEVLATSSPEPGRRRRGLSYPAAAAGPYRFRISSADESVDVVLSETHPVSSRAVLTLKLLSPSGGVLKTLTADSGTIDLNHEAESEGHYLLEVKNESSSVPVPFFALPWSVTALSPAVATGSLGSGQTATHEITADDGGYVRSTVDWTQGSGPTTEAVTGNISARGSVTREIHPTADGDITAEVDWSSSTTSGEWNRTVGTLSTWQTIIIVGASGAINANLTWPEAIPNPDLDLYLIDGESGAQLAASEGLTGNSESVSYSVTGVSHPAKKDYILRVRAKGAGSSFTLTSTWPVTADLDLELHNSSGQKIASSYSAANKPERVSVLAQPAGDYTVRIISKNHFAPYSLVSTYVVLKYAAVSMAIKDQGGNTIASTNSSSGQAEITGEIPNAGTYVLEVMNTSTGREIPSYEATTWTPRTGQAALTLTLKNSQGVVVAADLDPVSNPKAIQAQVQPGIYTLEAQSVNGWGDALLTAAYPGGQPKEEIRYTANDHVYYVDDGTFRISETVSPAGRVLRRRVVEIGTNLTLEDVIFGYDGPGDAPSYSRPFSTQSPSQTPVTSFVQGPNGLLVIDVAGQASYPLENGHGDLIGSTDGQGNFSLYPQADEFGGGTPPDSRLGWLGDHLRFSVGGALNFYRMGVRFYDPRIGRFLQVDPIEGGSANDYDYVNQDPCNAYDLDGRVPSCASNQFVGNAGTLYTQVSPKGTYQWAIRMHDPKLDSGLWFYRVYVNGKGNYRWRFQTYAPHGSVKPSRAPSGSIVNVRAYRIGFGPPGRYGIWPTVAWHVKNHCQMP